MKRLIIAFILVSLTTACNKYSGRFYSTSDSPYPDTYESPGEVAFGPLAAHDRKQYLIEQQALINSKLQERGITTKIEAETLIVNIPGNIAFDVNSARLNWNVHDILDRITPTLKEYKYTSILVLGHSDGKGDRDVNQLLSEQRARLIRGYFVNSGLDVNRITSRGVGGDDLLVTDELTTQDRSLNRRITLEIKIDDSLVEKKDSNK